MACWLLLQSWETLRFADHRGLEPRNVPCEGGALIAKLTRSKTLGTDKAVKRTFDAETGSWMGGICSKQKLPTKGTTFFQPQAEILQESAAQGITVRYSIRGANATTVVALLSWVQALQLDFPALLDPSQRSELLTKSCICPGSGDAGQELVRGGAQHRIAQIQRDVIKLGWDTDALYPLAESDSLGELAKLLRSQQINEEEITRSTRLLSSRWYSEAVRTPSTELAAVESQLDVPLELDERSARETGQGKAASVEHGTDRKNLAKIRGHTEQSCALLSSQENISSSSKKGIRTYMISGTVLHDPWPGFRTVRTCWVINAESGAL